MWRGKALKAVCGVSCRLLPFKNLMLLQVVCVFYTCPLCIGGGGFANPNCPAFSVKLFLNKINPLMSKRLVSHALNEEFLVHLCAVFAAKRSVSLLSGTKYRSNLSGIEHILQKF